MEWHPFDFDGEKITRADFIRLSAAAAAVAAIQPLQGCAGAPPRNIPDIDYGRDIVISNCTVIDVKGGTARPGSSLLVRRGIIQAVETGGISAPGALSFDARGACVIPGLVDAHCHPTITSSFTLHTADLSRHLAFQKRQFSIGIEHGITTYRDVGSFPLTLHGMIKDIEKGRFAGPRVVYCNSMLNIRGGHPDIPPKDAHPLANLAALFTGMVMTNFESYEELQRAMEKNAAGASFIKLTMDDRSVFCKKDPIPVYSDEMLAHIFARSRETGLPVSCHVHRKFGFDRAMKYPVHSLEHMVSDAYLSDADVELMASKNVASVPTMTIGLSYLMEEAYDTVPERFRSDFIMNEVAIRREYLRDTAPEHCDPVIHEKNMRELGKYRSVGHDNLWKKKIFLVNPEIYFGMIHFGTKNLLKMRDAGITIGLGIDAGMPLSYFGGQYRELEFLSRAGFRNDEILRIATVNGARILRMEETIGSIEKGKFADLVFLAANPLENIRACRSPEIVMKEGKFLYSRGDLAIGQTG